MTVTAMNTVSPRCTSRLLLGQGYSNEIRKGEDAILTTVNIDHFSTTSAPATPFNIYALENGHGLSIDLLDSVVYVPISFYMSELPYNEVSLLWFTGVNKIDGPLVLFDALTGTEQPIVDGICIAIETPTQSHEIRYYIRRPGYDPDKQGDPDNPIATGVGYYNMGDQAVKIIHNGQVYVLRNGHVYTMLGQKVR